MSNLYTGVNKQRENITMQIKLTLNIDKDLSIYKDKEKRFFEELYKNFLEQDRAITSVEIEG